MDKQNTASYQSKKFVLQMAVGGLLVVITMSILLSGCATTQDTVSTQNDTSEVPEKTALVVSNTQKKSDLSKEELLSLFEQFYSDYKKDKVSMDNEMFLVNWTPMPCKSIGTAEDATVYNQIELEVEFTSIDKQLPADGFQQYVEWRTQQEQKVSTPSVIPQQPKVAKTTLSSEPAREEPPVAPAAPKYSSDSGIETDWSLWDAEGAEKDYSAPSSYGFS